jgi:hypothetical protein
MSHDKSQKHTFWHKSNCYSLQAHTTSVFGTIWSCRPVIGSGPKQRRSCDLRRCWHLLSRTGNTCLSIQSLVPVTTFRCHFLVSPPPHLSYLSVVTTINFELVVVELHVCQLYSYKHYLRIRGFCGKFLFSPINSLYYTYQILKGSVL